LSSGLFRSDFGTAVFCTFFTSHCAACHSARLNHPDTLAQCCTSLTRKDVQISPITTFILILALGDHQYVAFQSTFCQLCPYKMALPLMGFSSTLTMTVYITTTGMCSTLVMFVYKIRPRFKKFQVTMQNIYTVRLASYVQNISWFIKHTPLLICIKLQSQS
jgi:hypothetical protein